MIMEKLSKNQIVFSKGDIGTKFYIILKGRVGILLPFLQADQVLYNHDVENNTI
jgi:CRP-like cAMP-binding protein